MAPIRIFLLITAGCLCFSWVFGTGVDLDLSSEGQQPAPVGFLENKGQVCNLTDNTPNLNVRFSLEQEGTTVFLMNDGITTQFEQVQYPAGYLDLVKKRSHDPQSKTQLEALRSQIRFETWRVDMKLVGSNPCPSITTEGKSEDYTHFYNRNALYIYQYQKVTFHDIYPGIDWVVYVYDGGIKYDFIVHPGADPNQIRIQYQHALGMELDRSGNLNVFTGMGQITELAPVSFQGGHPVHTTFALSESLVQINVSDYNPSRDLVIDPMVRLWGTYVGGVKYDEAVSSTMDRSGNIYLEGNTQSTSAIAAGGHQITYGGSNDAFLVKFNAAGVRLWSTYYGGTGVDIGYSTATDTFGCVFLTGYTKSTSAIAAGGHQNTWGGDDDAFLVKFDSNGIRQWGTYFGGFDSDEGWSVSTDATGNVYLAGYSASGTAIASAGHQNTYAGNGDAFLVKFNSAGVRQWGTYYGGTGIDYGCSTTTDASGNVFLSGLTYSVSAIASGGHQNTFGGGGGSDAFLVKFNSTGARQWGTYYGNTGNEYSYSVTTDATGNIFLSGNTQSTTAIAAMGHQNTYGGGNDAFLVKFNSSGVRLWGTYYGGSGMEEGWSTTTDDAGNVYLAGWTGSSAAIAAGGHQNSIGGGNDAFLVKFDASGVRQWGTYYGGAGDEVGYSPAVDALGNIYFTGRTDSIYAISTVGAFQYTFGGIMDGFLVKFNECTNSFSTITTNACDTYILNSVTYDSTGTYTQTLINAAGCDSTITLNLTITNVDSSVTLTSGTLTALPGYTYQWLDCNTGYAIISGANSQNFMPSVSGNYAVQVTSGACVDTSACFNVTVVGMQNEVFSSISLYPNPTHDRVTVSGLTGPCPLSLVNTLGQVVLEAHTQGAEHTLDVSGLPAGVYTLRITSDQGTGVRKLVVE